MDELNVDVVLECTGLFKSKEKAELHLKLYQSSSLPSVWCRYQCSLWVNHTYFKDHKLYQTHHVQQIVWLL